MTTASSGTTPDGAGSSARRGRRTGVAADVARAIRNAPKASPLVSARRKIVQHLADALEAAMREGADLKVVKLNGQLEAAIRRAELEDAPGPASRGRRSGEVTPDASDLDGLDAELAELAAREPAPMGDTSES